MDCALECPITRGFFISNSASEAACGFKGGVERISSLSGDLCLSTDPSDGGGRGGRLIGSSAGSSGIVSREIGRAMLALAEEVVEGVDSFLGTLAAGDVDACGAVTLEVPFVADIAGGDRAEVEDVGLAVGVRVVLGAMGFAAVGRVGVETDGFAVGVRPAVEEAGLAVGVRVEVGDVVPVGLAGIVRLDGVVGFFGGPPILDVRAAAFLVSVLAPVFTEDEDVVRAYDGVFLSILAATSNENGAIESHVDCHA